MSLCSDCFHAGNHVGHDFNMFRSQAGGACDCGDVSVMSAQGYLQLFHLANLFFLGEHYRRMKSCPSVVVIDVYPSIIMMCCRLRD